MKKPTHITYVRASYQAGDDHNGALDPNNVEMKKHYEQRANNS